MTGVFGAVKPRPVEWSRKESESVPLSGKATFEVHGTMPKSICMPLVPVHTNGEIRVVLTWGEFPHNLVLKVSAPDIRCLVVLHMCLLSVA